ncbi:hypothetical protein ACFV6F_01475 [Kitasatospora phosalacinea]|uniref:hypothetical protein n=1 Tax=Kitasatospora phosalacinea TaxID=2065 RepID=UPI00364A4EA9
MHEEHGGTDPLHLPESYQLAHEGAGLIGDAVEFLVDAVGDAVDGVADLLGLHDDPPASAPDHHGPAPQDAPPPDHPADSPVEHPDQVADRLLDVYHHPESATGPAQPVGPAQPAPGSLPAGPAPEPLPAGPYHDPVIDQVAAYNPAAADTMAFIHGVMNADPRQLDAMNAQLEGMVAQDRIHLSVAEQEQRVALDNAHHQAVQDADRTVVEAEGVLGRDPT